MEHLNVEHFRAQDRSFSIIERELMEAEKAHADAQAKLEAAKLECDAAIERINCCQQEFDQLLTARRKASPAGSRWHAGATGLQPPLLLSRSDQVAEARSVPRQYAESPETKVVRAISEQADRLR